MPTQFAPEELDPELVVSVIAIALVLGMFYVAFKVLRWSLRFGRDQVRQKFWRNAGKVSTLISFVLLAVAYGFYSQEQSRTLGEALTDLGKEQLTSVMPLAVLTQFALLGGFWILFGRMMGMTWRQLLQPGSNFVTLIFATAQLLLFTTVLLSLIDGHPGQAAAAFGAMLVVSYFNSVVYASPELHVAAPQPQRGPIGRIMLGQPGGSRWRIPVVSVLLITLVWLIIYGFLAGIAALAIANSDLDLPDLGTVLNIEVIVMSVLFLLWCYHFRSTASEVEGTPPALFHFVDLSLAFAACVLALTGLPDSEVTLGDVPVWLIAAGPALVVVALVYLIHVQPKRIDTPRWGLSLMVSLIAGLLVIPVKYALTTALAPLIDLFPLPAL